MNEAGVTYRTEHGEVFYSMQDMEDGRTLRRLREALPEAWSYELTFDPLDVPPDDFVVFARHEDDLDPRASGFGRTIAEAADKCREAIGRALEGNG